jgi:ribosomal protein S11
MMFQHRASELDPRVSAIAGHLRAIEKELGGIGRSASRNASASASTAGKQIAEAIWPILNDIVDRFGRGQRAAVDEAASLGNETVKISAITARPCEGVQVNDGGQAVIGNVKKPDTA